MRQIYRIYKKLGLVPPAQARASLKKNIMAQLAEEQEIPPYKLADETESVLFAAKAWAIAGIQKKIQEHKNFWSYGF